VVIFNNVSKFYGVGEAQVKAIQELNLEISAGEFTCIFGASGSGKSTLLNLLGLLDKPNSGEIQFDGVNIDSLKENELADFRNEKIGFVFQGFNLIPVLSSLENVMVPQQIRGVSSSVAKKRATELLSELGLESELNRRPDMISGGQRQRVAIARALINKPALVIADEPTANLDSQTAESIVALLKSLNHAQGITFVVATHDPSLSMHASNNLFIKDGKIRQEVVAKSSVHQFDIRNEYIKNAS